MKIRTSKLTYIEPAKLSNKKELDSITSQSTKPLKKIHQTFRTHSKHLKGRILSDLCIRPYYPNKTDKDTFTKRKLPSLIKSNPQILIQATSTNQHVKMVINHDQDPAPGYRMAHDWQVSECVSHQQKEGQQAKKRYKIQHSIQALWLPPEPQLSGANTGELLGAQDQLGYRMGLSKYKENQFPQ